MKKDRKQENMHDYYESYAPAGVVHNERKTFSLGIFKWTPRASFSGLKKSAVVYRVKGMCGEEAKVFKRAEAVCDLLDSGKTMKRKSEFVR